MNDPFYLFDFKKPPFKHQRLVFDEHRDDDIFALFWEMGLGKSKEILDVAAHKFLTDKIQALLVLAPKPVTFSWATDQVPDHLAVPHALHYYRTKSTDDRKLRRLLFLDPRTIDASERLRVVCMSYDSLRTDDGEEFAQRLVKLYPTMMVLDESTAIKNRETVIAKACKHVGRQCVARWIATGTPAAQSPFDLHSQIEFLDPDFWKQRGLKTWSAFKTEFGVYETRRFGARTFQKVTGYRNVQRLREMTAPMCSRLLKEDSEVQLPPKLYTIKHFELTEKQRDTYDRIANSMIAEIEGDPNAYAQATIAITRLMRLQQICSGFVADEPDLDPVEYREQELDAAEQQTKLEEWPQRPELQDDSEYARALPQVPLRSKEERVDLLKTLDADDLIIRPIEEILGHEGVKIIVPRERRIVDVVPPDDNPKLQLLREIIEACHPTKLLVFCRFTHEVDTVCTSLGDTALRYDGRTSQRDRESNITKFRDPLGPRVLVANVHALSHGVTLIEAKKTVYYSRDFSLEKNLQSEDRNHRIGQDVSVQIIDLVAQDTVEERVVEALRTKYDISREVTGDRMREWIQPARREA